MELNKVVWTENDIGEYSSYLISLRGESNACEFEKRIVGTDMECLAIKSQTLKKIANIIYSGNYTQFLSYWAWNNHAETLIIGNILNKIKDFSSFKAWLYKYANKCDNWATCDVIKPRITKENKEEIYNLAISYTCHKKTFVRRIGFRILFNYIDDKIDEILNTISKCANETEYYVNMIIAWLLCECFIKQREKTLKVFQNNNVNAFAINKAIQKCRESFRVSENDKELLNKYKKR